VLCNVTTDCGWRPGQSALQAAGRGCQAQQQVITVSVCIPVRISAFAFLTCYSWHICNQSAEVLLESLH